MNVIIFTNNCKLPNAYSLINQCDGGHRKSHNPVELPIVESIHHNVDNQSFLGSSHQLHVLLMGIDWLTSVIRARRQIVPYLMTPFTSQNKTWAPIYDWQSERKRWLEQEKKNSQDRKQVLEQAQLRVLWQVLEQTQKSSRRWGWPPEQWQRDPRTFQWNKWLEITEGRRWKIFLKLLLSTFNTTLSPTLKQMQCMHFEPMTDAGWKPTQYKHSVSANWVLKWRPTQPLFEQNGTTGAVCVSKFN